MKRAGIAAQTDRFMTRRDLPRAVLVPRPRRLSNAASLRRLIVVVPEPVKLARGLVPSLSGGAQVHQDQ